MAVNSTRRTRIAGGAAALIGAGAATLMMASPANAAVTDIEVTTPSGYGSTAGVYGDQCSYDIEVTVDEENEGVPVTFWVAKDGDDATELDEVQAEDGKATYSWTPGAPGSYVIAATQDGQTGKATGELQVGSGFEVPAPELGKITIQLPLAGSCIVTSS
ncbi:hypothetical protein ACIGKQ_00190 [Gordonia sp. NPDC062954]|uniref:hypothetical protein n=1 Tax=Gordonia sp. NPDC062954 TaxID=3364003 RepID=UPI0037C90D2C